MFQTPPYLFSIPGLRDTYAKAKPRRLRYPLRPRASTDDVFPFIACPATTRVERRRLVAVTSGLLIAVDPTRRDFSFRAAQDPHVKDNK